MSKLIESLKAGAREFSKKQEVENGGESRKSEHQLTQQQLADIYFSGSDKTKRSDTPMIIRVVEKPRMASLLPWLIASIAFLITAFSLFSTKRIFVDIKVIDENSPYVAALRDGAVPDAGSVSERASDARGRKLPLESFVFEGASQLRSSSRQSNLTLVNSSVAPFARASLFFEAPADMAGQKIVFYAKGARGGEKLGFALKDTDNRQAFAGGEINPFPEGLTTQWSRGEIPLLHTAPGFDERSVTSLRFEFGSKNIKNQPGDTIFIKDLRMVPA